MSRTESFRDFVLQARDPVTRTVCVERRIRISNVDRLRNILDLDDNEDPDLQLYYTLSSGLLERVGELCDVSFFADAQYETIKPWSPYNGVPYMLHTNFELPLMLEGRKPFAMFLDGYPSAWFDEYLAPFDPFVEDGTLVRRVIDCPMPHLKRARPDLEGMRRVYFALPAEAWRIDAHLLLMDVREKSEWNDSLERFEGSLLGYQDWQNDWWIANLREFRTQSAK
jgi:hypothetical protein